MFEDDFFLLYRRSEYAAQIELAVAKMFHYFMGYGPEMYIVNTVQGFFVASRRIKNFKTGCSFFRTSNSYDRFSGLAAMFVLCYFLCETDMHSSNYGMHESAILNLFFKIDNPEALDWEMLKSGLSITSLNRIPYIRERYFYGVTEEDIPTTVVESSRFQQEKMNMIQKIASTSFSELEKIIRETVTVDFYSHIVAIRSKLIQMNPENAEMIGQPLNIDPSQFSLEMLVNKLSNRHVQLIQAIEDESLEQDYSLSSSINFFAEAERYHSDNSSEEEDYDINEKLLCT